MVGLMVVLGIFLAGKICRSGWNCLHGDEEVERMVEEVLVTRT